MNCRVYVEHLGVSRKANWNAGAKTLVLEPVAHGETGNGFGGPQQKNKNLGQRYSAGGRGGRDGGRGGGGSAGEAGRGGRGGQKGAMPSGNKRLDPCDSEFCYEEWIAALAAGAVDGRIQNPSKLQPTTLPLRVSRGIVWYGALGRCTNEG